MFSKFSVLPTVSIYLKGSKRLLHMSKKFACANVTNRQYFRQCGLNIQDDQPACSGSRYLLCSANMQMRLMSSTDSKDGDFDKSKESTSDLKTDNKDPTTDVKVVKKILRRKSGKESRESYKKGDRFKFTPKRRRNQRDLTAVPILFKAKKETCLKFPKQQVADLLKNKEEHKEIDVLKNLGISQSTLPPKRLHVEYIESINLKDIELKKNPSSNPDTKGIKRNIKLASEATQLTSLYLESKNQVPIQMEKENQPQSNQWRNEADEPNFRIIVNLGSISPMDKQPNSKPSASNDTKSSPKDTQTKPPVVVRTMQEEIQILPLNAGHKVDSPQNIEDVEKKKSINKYKPLGLRYIKFSKMMDRIASGNIKSLKPPENPLAGDNTTLQKKPNVEKLKLSELFKPTSSNATPVSEIEAEKLSLAMTPEVENAKHLKNTTTLQKQSNSDIFQLPDMYKNTADSTQIKNKPLPLAQELETPNSHSKKSTLKEKSNNKVLKLTEKLKSTVNFDETYESTTETKNISNSIVKNVKPKAEVEASKVFGNEKSKELNRGYNRNPQMNNEIKLESPLTAIASNSEVKLTADQDIKISNADTPTRQKKSKVEKLNFSEMLKPTSLNVTPVSEIEAPKISFEMTQEVESAKRPKNTTTLQKLPEIYKTTSFKNTADSTRIKNEPLPVAQELETPKSHSNKSTLKEKSNSEVIKLSKSEVEPSRVLGNEKSKELNRRYNRTPQMNNEIKLESPVTPISSNSGSNDTKSSPKDTQTRPPVVVNTIKEEIQILPLNAGHNVNRPQKIEDADKKKSRDKYKPLGLRYTKFSKMMDRIASAYVKPFKPPENPLSGHHTTSEENPKAEKLSLSELLKPTSLNATPISEIKVEKLSFTKTQAVESAKHPKNTTTLQKQSNSDIFQLPEIYKNTADSTQIKNKLLPVAQELDTPNKSTLKEKSNSEVLKLSDKFKSTSNFDGTYESATETKNNSNSIVKNVKPKAEVEASIVLGDEKSKELNRRYNRNPQMNNEIKLESPVTPITSNSEVKLTTDQDIKIINADTPNRQKKPKVEKLNFSEMLKPTSLNVTPVSEIEAMKISFEMTPTTLQKLPKIHKTTSFKNTADSTQIKNEQLPVAKELETPNSHSTKSTLKEKSNSEVKKLSDTFKKTGNFDETYESATETKNISNSIVKDVNPEAEVEASKVLGDKKSKDLNRRYNRTPQMNNAIKLESPLTPITSNSEVKLTTDQDIKIINADTPKSLNTSMNSVDIKLEEPPTPTYTNVKAKIEQANNEILLKDTKPTLTESLPRTTITNRTVKATKSGVFNYKTKTFHSKHSAHEELKKIKPKFISKYKRAEMFKKATEKILGRLESAKSKIGQKADLPTSIVNDLKTPAFENLSAIQDNQATEKTLQSDIKSPKDVEITNTIDKSNLPNFKLKNLESGRVERDTIANIDTHKTIPKTVSANSDKYKLLPKLDTDILKVKKVPKVLENDIKIEKEGATDVGNVSPTSLDTFKAKNSPPPNKIYQSLNMAKNKNSTKSERGNMPPPFVNILNAKNSPPSNQSLNLASNKNSTKSEQGNIHPPSVDTVKAKNSPPSNQSLNFASNKNSTKSEQGYIPVPSVDTTKAKNSPPSNQSLNLANNKNSTKSEQGNIPAPSVDIIKAKNSPPSNQSLNLASNKNSTKSEQGNIPAPSVDIIKAKNSPLSNQSLNLASNKNSSKSEKATKKTDTRIWTTLPRAQGEISFSTTNINSKSKSVEPMKQPFTDVGKGNQGTYKPSNTIRENESKFSTIGENPTNPVTSVSRDKYLSSTSPSHYPKNMFGEIISPEQLRKSQEKLRAFQTNLDVTTARPSPKKSSNQQPDNVSRPVPSKKPASDGGSGNEGGDNSGGSEDIHDTESYFANFWSTAIVTTISLALSFMIYLMKELPPLNPWQQFFTSLTKEQTEAILRIHQATYEKSISNSDVQDNTEKDLLQESIVTGSNENGDQNNSNDIRDPKMVKFDKKTKFEDV